MAGELKAVVGEYGTVMYREQDQPLDRAGQVQKYLAVHLRFSFDVSEQDLGIGKPKSLTTAH
jgi:hypothetical protein